MARLAPIDYIQRTRAYYMALRFGDPYEWAHHEDIPFTPFEKPLAEARVGLVTTAAKFRPECGDQGPGAKYNGAAKFFEVYAESAEGEPDVRISHIAIDRYLPRTVAAPPSRTHRRGRGDRRYHFERTFRARCRHRLPSGRIRSLRYPGQRKRRKDE